MKKWALFGLLAVSSAALAGPTVNLYTPVRAAKDQGLTLVGWGSGSITETDDAAYDGTQSLRISTRSYFQGGRIVFQSPIDLKAVSADSSNMLRFVVKVADGTVSGGGPGKAGPGKSGAGVGSSAGGGGGTASGEGPGGGAPGRGGGPRGGGSGDPRGAGGGSGNDTAAAASAFDSIRVVITTTDGLKSEAYLPLSGAGGKDGWRMVAVPLKAISGFTRTNAQVSEVAIAGNTTTTFYLGEVKIASDETPISGDTNVTELNLGLGEEVVLWANGYAGATMLKYTWDFDASDGIQVDAEGQAVRRRFRKSGKFTVTVTISDEFGQKKPFTRTIEVTVN